MDPRNLTPIKVAGKNKRSKSKAAKSARKIQKQRARLQPLHNSSNPPSTLASRSTTPYTPTHPRQKSRKPPKPPRPKYSQLEKLPVEILQRIFTFCYNFNLPQTSPVIRDKLSHEYVYQKSIMHAFGPSWTQSLVGLQGLPVEERGVRITITEGNAELQTRLLKCRWATLEILLSAQQRWLMSNNHEPPAQPAKPNMINLDFAEPGAAGDNVLQDFDFDSFMQPDIPSPPPPPSAFPLSSLPQAHNHLHNNLTEMESLKQEYKRLQAIVQQYIDGQQTHSFGHTQLTQLNLHPTLRMHPSTQIPTTLLIKPIDPLHLLHLLRLCPVIDWISTAASETLTLALQTSIQTGNLLHLVLLDSLQIGSLIHEKLIVSVLKEGGGDKALAIVQLLGMMDRGGFYGGMDRSRVYRGLAVEAWARKGQSAEMRSVWERLNRWLGLRRYLGNGK